MADEPKSTALSIPPTNPTAQPLAPAESKRDRYTGASSKPCSQEQGAVLMAPVPPVDVEIRPDGIIYLPEIKYRRVLNRAFGPMGWSLIPCDAVTMQDKTMTRAYALYADGRFVAEARGEMDYIPNNEQMTYATTTEGVKSNALMRCCKDLGIASELWDPGFIEAWKREYAVSVWVEGRNKPQWRRKDRQPFYKETGTVEQAHAQNVPAATPKASPFVKPKQVIDVQAEAKPEPIVVIPEPHPADVSNEEGIDGTIGIITRSSEKSGGTKDKPWTRFGFLLKPEGGEAEFWVNTFDDRIAQTASEAKTDGKPRFVRHKPTKDGKFRDLVSVGPIDEDIPF